MRRRPLGQRSPPAPSLGPDAPPGPKKTARGRGLTRRSQLAERGGRSGAAYRAVLPGDLHVVVRVVEGAVAGLREDDDNPAAAATAFRELARLRHPNILPLLGYCIAGE